MLNGMVAKGCLCAKRSVAEAGVWRHGGITVQSWSPRAGTAQSVDVGGGMEGMSWRSRKLVKLRCLKESRSYRKVDACV